MLPGIEARGESAHHGAMRSFIAIAAAALALRAALPEMATAQSSDDKAVRCPATLPAPVAARQRSILAAARAGDYAALRREVTAPGRFQADFDTPRDPAPAWQEARRQGIDIAAAVAAIFAMPCSVIKAEGKTLYNWPSAMDFQWAELTPAERAPLERFYGAKIDQQWLEGRAKGYYVGWRGIIEADGTWVAFVAGD
jgi:hypothetical protein